MKTLLWALKAILQPTAILQLSHKPTRTALDRPLQLLLLLVLSALCLPCISAATGGVLSLDSGTCVIDGSCATSPGFPSGYGNNEECSITVEAAGYMTATTFVTESCCDKLTVDDSDYSGSTGPFNQLVPSGAAVEWKSDPTGTAAGWRLCYSIEAAATPAPSTSPTVATECGMFVDASNGADSGTCGSNSSDACASIQRGIDNIQQDGRMLCISEGAQPSIRFRVIKFSLVAVLQVRTAARVGGPLELTEASPSRGLVLDPWSIAMATDPHSASCLQDLPSFVLLVL
jgi:hypothetical protein